MLGRRDTRGAGRLRPLQNPTRGARAFALGLPLAVPLAVALALPLVCTSCLGLAVGAGAGYLVGLELEPKGQRTETLYVPLENAWLVTKDVLGIMTSEPLEFIEFPRTAIARIDGSRVSVEVTVYDVDRTQVRVHAKRLGFPAGETANRVLEVISSRLEEQGHGL